MNPLIGVPAGRALLPKYAIGWRGKRKLESRKQKFAKEGRSRSLRSRRDDNTIGCGLRIRHDKLALVG
jgi:hypothetical protein